jgi:hypothetical protein
VVNIGLNYKVVPHIVIGTELNYFQLKAKSSSPTGQNITEFSSQNFDLKLYGRFFYFEEKYRTPTDRAELKRFNPFAQIGVGVVYYNPVSTIINPADTPGTPALVPEKKTYPAYSLMLPVSLGFSYSISRKVKFIAEGVFTYAFTDYLDTRSGGPTGTSIGTDDTYLMALAKMQLTLGSDAVSRKARKKPVAKSDKQSKPKKVKSKTGLKSKPLQRRLPNRKAPKRHPK